MGQTNNKELPKPGERVKIAYGSKAMKAFQKNHGGWTFDMLKLLNRIGIVEGRDEYNDIKVTFPKAGTYAFNPITLNGIRGTARAPSIPKTFNPGELVYILHDINEVVKMQNQYGGWIDSMVWCVGKIGLIKMVYDNVLKIRVGHDTWIFTKNATLEIDPKELQLFKEELKDDIIFDEGDIVELKDSTPEGYGYVKRVLEKGYVEVWYGDGVKEMKTSALSKVAPCQTAAPDTNDDTVTLIGTGIEELSMNDKSYHGKFLKAVKNNNVKEVRRILSMDTDVNYTFDGHTALHVASFFGHTETLQVLFDKGADLSVKDKDGDNAIHLAAYGNKPETVSVLVDEGVDPNLKNNTGQTPLHLAAQRGLLAVGRCLLDSGANSHLTDKIGDTPMHDAIRRCHPDFVEMLLQRGADPFLENMKGYDALLLAAITGENRCLEVIIKYLREKKKTEFVNTKKHGGLSSLHLTAYNGHIDAARVLIVKGGAIKNSRNKYQQTPLHIAVNQLHREMVEYLLKAGCPINDQDEQGDSPLHEAFRRHAIFTSPQLEQLAQDTDTPHNKTDPEIAAGIALYLAEHGADTTMKNKEGLTPLDISVDHGLKARVVSAALNTSPQSLEAVGGATAAERYEGLDVPDGKMHARSALYGHDDDKRESKEFYQGLDIPEAKALPNSVLCGRHDEKRDRNLNIVSEEFKLWKLETACPICFDRPKKVLLGCRHGYCETCVQRLAKCALCNKDITQREHLF